MGTKGQDVRLALGSAVILSFVACAQIADINEGKPRVGGESPNGTLCSLDSECASGECVDGVCCESACEGMCQGCSVDIKGQGTNGICGPIMDGLDPNSECTDGSCNGAGVCEWNTGIQCVANGDCISGQCVDGVCCENACTGTCKSCNVVGFAGSCVNVPAHEDDANGAPPCVGTSQSCDGNGVCKKENGQTATDSSECVSGFLADGVCCDSACSETCKACDLSDNVGTCSNVPALQDDADTCSGSANSCDGNGACGKELGQTCAQNDQCLWTACLNGKCTPPSCNGLSSNCGILSSQNCCTSYVVPGGTYNRSNNPLYPATVSDFRLDRFEITVGRFRKFVEAYPGSKPASGAGAHPLISGSGWDSAWNANLPADQAALKAALKCSASNQTWTDTIGSNEGLPMNCINWYEAFAFCAWDGGRLPTEAEWNYAAAGGSEQRVYPWGAATPDGTYAVYDCLGDGSAAQSCAFADILKVGSKPKGDGKWGQADLSGSIWEWNFDWYQSPYATPCDNCANTNQAVDRVGRGGGWNDQAFSLLSEARGNGTLVAHFPAVGARCARSP